MAASSCCSGSVAAARGWCGGPGTPCWSARSRSRRSARPTRRCWRAIRGPPRCCASGCRARRARWPGSGGYSPTRPLPQKADADLGVAHPTDHYVIVKYDIFTGEPSLLVYAGDSYGSGYLAADFQGQVKKQYPRGG